MVLSASLILFIHQCHIFVQKKHLGCAKVAVIGSSAATHGTLEPGSRYSDHGVFVGSDDGSARDTTFTSLASC